MVYEPIESRVLLISDPMFPGNAVIDILRETGIGIELISDAEDIFFKLKKGNIGLVLIDVVTINPSMMDLIERLQSYVQEMPVVVMSAETTYRQLKPLLHFKEFYYLNKPYQNDEFLILVRRLLSTWALKSAKIKMQERFQIRESELELYSQAGRLLASAARIQEKLGQLFDRVAKLVPSEAWNLILIDPDTGELVFSIISGKAQGDTAPRMRPGQGIAGWAATRKAPAIVENVKKNRHFSPEVEKVTGLKVHSMLCVPIIYAESTVGVVQLINRSAQTTYSDSDVEIISPFADYAALAIANWRLQKQNEELCTTDPLTGLFNTKQLDLVMDFEIEKSTRYRLPLCFMIIDVDNYYDLCERLGREAGTELVKEVSELVAKRVRTVDTLARYAADRFAALVPNTPSAEGAAMAERIRSLVENHTFLASHNAGDRVTVSIGLAGFPQDAKTKNDLVSLAHIALEFAKKEGKNRVVSAEYLKAHKYIPTETKKAARAQRATK